MKIELAPGTYVVAVSGGVDSMVLLDMLSKKYQSPVASRQSSVKTGDRRQGTGDGVRLVVAHFDHGIRTASDVDRKLVEYAAKSYGLQFVYDEGRLGAGASEDTARKARYEFLHKVRESAGARAVITAHHQDDLIETAIINILRGTGRRGLSSLRSTDVVKRPLFKVSKKEIIKYARTHNLKWHEDPTNADTRYLRNYVRHRLLPRLDKEGRAKLINIVTKMAGLNDSIDGQIINYLHLHPATDRIDRYMFIMLPQKVAAEVMAAWLRRHGVRQFDKKTIERLVVAAKTLSPRTQADVNIYLKMVIEKDHIRLSTKSPASKPDTRFV